MFKLSPKGTKVCPKCGISLQEVSNISFSAHNFHAKRKTLQKISVMTYSSSRKTSSKINSLF